MDTLIIQLTNAKAYKLLQDMEDLKLIQIVRQRSRLSELKKGIKNRMTDQQIDQQMNSMRNEWQRDI